MKRAVFALGCMLLTPVMCWAQGTATSPKLPPGMTISGAIGKAFSSAGAREPAIAGSVEIAMNRFMVVQGEISTERRQFTDVYGGFVVSNSKGTGFTGTQHYDVNERRTSILGNFIARVGAGRVFVLAGAGLGTHVRSADQLVTYQGCVPLAGSITCPTNPGPTRDHFTAYEFVPNVLAGVEVRLTPQLTAFATVRSNETAAAFAGVRWTARRAPVAPGWSSPAPARDAVKSAVGKDVHVVAWDSSRQTGTLVNMTDSAVTIRTWQGDRTVPLSEVRGIRRVSHAIRDGALIGLGGGGVFGLVACLGGGCEGDDGVYVGESLLLFGGLGAGIGAVTGAIVNLTQASSRVIWLSPKPSGLALSPVVGPKTAGVAGRISW